MLAPIWPRRLSVELPFAESARRWSDLGDHQQVARLAGTPCLGGDCSERLWVHAARACPGEQGPSRLSGRPFRTSAGTVGARTVCASGRRSLGRRCVDLRRTPLGLRARRMGRSALRLPAVAVSSRLHVRRAHSLRCAFLGEPSGTPGAGTEPPAASGLALRTQGQRHRVDRMTVSIPAAGTDATIVTLCYARSVWRTRRRNALVMGLDALDSSPAEFGQPIGPRTG